MSQLHVYFCWYLLFLTPISGLLSTVCLFYSLLLCNRSNMKYKQHIFHNVFVFLNKLFDLFLITVREKVWEKTHPGSFVVTSHHSFAKKDETLQTWHCFINPHSFCFQQYEISWSTLNVQMNTGRVWTAPDGRFPVNWSVCVCVYTQQTVTKL